MKPEIEISPGAEKTLLRLVKWFEQQNTPGGGTRFLNNFIRHLYRLRKGYPFYSPCANRILKLKGLRCARYRDWIIAIQLGTDTMIIQAIIHKRQLVS